MADPKTSAEAFHHFADELVKQSRKLDDDCPAFLGLAVYCREQARAADRENNLERWDKFKVELRKWMGQ